MKLEELHQAYNLSSQGRGTSPIPATSGHTYMMPLDDAEVVPLRSLSEHEVTQWESLRRADSNYRTPYFSIAFARGVDQARGDVLVARLKSAGVTVGFFPFHQIKSTLYPVGRRFNDAHGVLSGPGLRFDWVDLVKKLGGKGFEYHSLVGVDQERMPHDCVMSQVGSFAFQVGCDSENALHRLQQSHRTIAKQTQKTRKLAREVGPLRLEVDCRDTKLLDEAIERKRSQYRRTCILDLFLPDWTRRLVHELANNSKDSPRTMLTLLWAGDRVVASHIGFREGDWLHYWFPAYEPEFAKYSPGTALFTELIREATAAGLKTIDMGFGEQPYKMKQTDTRCEVLQGYCSASMIRKGWYRIHQKAKRLKQQLPQKERLKYVLRSLYPRAGYRDFE